jgi:hypothetical protein
VAGLRIWLLGGFRVSVGRERIVDTRWRLRKARSLVKLLALAPGHRLHREQIIELLWPELTTDAAANQLRKALHEARRVLSPDPANTFRYLDTGQPRPGRFPGPDPRTGVARDGRCRAGGRLRRRWTPLAPGGPGAGHGTVRVRRMDAGLDANPTGSLPPLRPSE